MNAVSNLKVSLDDKYLSNGLAFMTGVHALVRLPMIQKTRDEAAGLNTAGYISGYRGSPLARYDLELGHASRHLAVRGIRVALGVNEDLALTSVWGSQQAEAHGRGKYDGVFAIWYAKGPGVDRSGDALRHANLAGSSRHGGVLALLGDDHGCESSSTAHQSEFAMVDYQLPVLNPATVPEILEYGLHGWAMSRYCGSWVALKCIHDTVEASSVVDLSVENIDIKLPTDFAVPPDGLNLRAADTPMAQERRQHLFKAAAAQAYARANSLDRTLIEPGEARIGIVTTGKAHGDFLQALGDLSLDLEDLRARGVGVHKVAMSWPLEPLAIREFCGQLDRVVVIEEKRSLIESQIKELLYGVSGAPLVYGKTDENRAILLPSTGTLSGSLVATALRRIFSGELGLTSAVPIADVDPPKPLSLLRLPYFCAGCPHNLSTKVPDDSRAMAGTGCNYMAQWMDRETLGFTHMGADGASWIGEAPFSNDSHIFQNMGDGTYFHSGLLAIRATIAAGVNITYKILYNDAVAMTGGQAHDGQLTVTGIASQLQAEGVSALAIVTDEPDKYGNTITDIAIHDRSKMDLVQREMRQIAGTTAIIYDQTCAAEKRRRRKKNAFPDPDRRIFINQAVCEGCGDCGVVSNCIAIVPVETEFGRKRAIDQSACNKDYSCANGFCPSFVSVSGAKPRKSSRAHGDVALADPALPAIDRDYSVLVAGIGGTGVITVSALLGMAARIENKGCALLDMTGLAQKGGSVISHVRFLPRPDVVAANRIGPGDADAIIGADLLVAVGGALETARAAHTRVIMNLEESLPGAFTRDPDLEFPLVEAKQILAQAVGERNITYVDATRIAVEYFGDAVQANVMLLGMAYQQGLIPVHASSIEEAITLNGVAVETSTLAFRHGRRLVADPGFGLATPRPVALKDLSYSEILSQRSAHLTDYQNAAYAARFERLVARVAAAERSVTGEIGPLAREVAISLSHLMAYKDEYEVGRLYSRPEFRQTMGHDLEGIKQIEVHLSPPFLSRTDPATGRPAKKTFGPWIFGVFRILACLRFLRGTALDPFGFTVERREERALLREFEQWVETIAITLDGDNHAAAVEIARLPQNIRGFGPVKMKAIGEYRIALQRIASL